MKITVTAKTRAVISAIRQYDDMRVIVSKIPESIRAKREDMASPPIPKLDGLPRVHNPHAGEAFLINSISVLEELEQRYEKAVVFLEWFEPMWLALPEKERRILETYKCADIRSGMVGEFAELANYSTRQLHRTRQQALTHLAFLLFAE
jgi:hypothetical protein